MSWGQIALSGYGLLAGAAYAASVIHRAWRRKGGEG